MSMTAFSALVKRDLKLYLTDRKAVLMSVAAPILIASFFGYIFGGAGGSAPASSMPVTVIDQDQSAVSKRLVAALGADKLLELRQGTVEQARSEVQSGKTTVAIVLPQGFGDLAAKALFRGADKPEIQMMYDPSHGAELGMVRGILTQHVMEAVSSEVFGANSQHYLDSSLHDLDRATGMDPADKKALRQLLESERTWSQRAQASPQSAGTPSQGFSMPYTAREEAVTARRGVEYNAMGHSFAGMTVQFILFMGIDCGIVLIYQRRSGIWKRLRAAPISRFVIIGSRATSSAIIAVGILFVVFGFARVVFHVRVEGSMLGFVGVCLAFGLMTAAFGLLVAVSGKTPEATRGLSIMVTLLMVMLGGAWVPAFIFPQWLQKASFVVPTRWAVDALDGMTWRGLSLQWSLAPIAALLGFAVLFGGLAVWRFRWDAPD